MKYDAIMRGQAYVGRDASKRTVLSIHANPDWDGRGVQLVTYVKPWDGEGAVSECVTTLHAFACWAKTRIDAVSPLVTPEGAAMIRRLTEWERTPPEDAI